MRCIETIIIRWKRQKRCDRGLHSSRKRIDQLYQDFDVQESYAIRIMERAKIPEPSAMFEPWMMPEEQDGRGVEDFRVRDRVHCGSSIVEYNMMQMLHTIMTAKLSDF